MKKYKQRDNLFITNFIILIISITLLVSTLNKYIPNYKVVDGNYVMKNVYNIITDSNTIKMLNKNPYIWINSDKYKIEIIEQEKKYYKDYDRVLIRIKNLRKNSNHLSISIYKEKKSFLKLFFECWEDKDEEN